MSKLYNLNHIAITAIIVFCVALFPGLSHAQNSKIDELNQLILEMAVPGAQIVHQKNGQIHEYNLGVKKYGTKDKVESNTIFQAASMSKVVAAYAFLRLYDKGVFDLDEPLMNYMDYAPLADDPYAGEMTARMVLNHTTGLPNWRRGKPLKAAFQPGTAFRYSGEGIVFLQRVVEHLTGKDLQQILEEEVFIPLGMKESSFVYRKDMDSDYAFGHHGKNGLKPTERRIFKRANSAYSMLTTARDYNIFVQKALLEGQGLKSETLEQFLTPSSSAKARNRSGRAYDHLSYGLGILLQENEVGKAVIHTGSNRGRYLCVFIGYPETKESIVILTNSSNGTEFREAAAQLLLEPQTLWVFQR